MYIESTGKSEVRIALIIVCLIQAKIDLISLLATIIRFSFHDCCIKFLSVVSPGVVPHYARRSFLGEIFI